MTLAARLAERGAVATLVVYGLVLPFEGIGRWTPRQLLGMQASDAILVLASPLLVAQVWRARTTIWGSRVLRASVALFVVGILTSLLRGSAHLHAEESGKLGVFLLAVASLAATPAMGQRERVMTAVAAGGGIAILASLVGYCWMLITAPPGDELTAFVVQSAHPVFDGFPRLAGTFRISPEAMGEYSAIILGVLVATRGTRRPWHAFALAGALVALVLTFSSAWVAGAVLGLGLMARAVPSRAVRWAVAGVCAAGVGVTFAAMNFGPPSAPGEPRRTSRFACAERETDHFVTWSPDSGRTCQQVAMSWPYAGTLTTYWQAKKTALEAIAHSPWLGRSRSAYRRFAAHEFVLRYSGGPRLGVFYEGPHCTPLDAIARFGVAGGAALLFLLTAVWRSRPASSAGPLAPLWLTTIGLMLVGLNVDLLERRPFWAVLGLLAASAQEETNVRSR